MKMVQLGIYIDFSIFHHGTSNMGKAILSPIQYLIELQYKGACQPGGGGGSGGSSEEKPLSVGSILLIL